MKKLLAILMMCFAVFAANAQVSLAPRTAHHHQAVQTPAMRSLTSEATVSMACTEQVGFTLGTPGTTTDWGFSCPDNYTISAEFFNGTYYLTTYPSGYLISIDPTSHISNVINPSSGINEIAYNPADGQMYGFNIETTSLYTVDLSTGTSTLVTAVNTDNTILAFTITNDGRFLLVDPTEDAICELNPNTGNVTVLINAGFDVNYIQDIAMDRETNTPYWASYNADASEAQLYSIDLANNSISLIGNFEDEVAGFATATFSTADATHPAAPTNFTVVPASDNSLSAELSWTNPSVDLGGNALTELTSMELFRNGTLINSFANPTVGGNMTYTDNTIPADGSYTYTIYGVNAAGNGASATTSALVGNMCEITIEMTDSYGDGWNGAAIQIIGSDNTILGSYSCNGSSTTTSIPLPVGTFTFSWVAGSYDDECSFTITNSFDIPLYQSNGAPVAGTFLTYTNTCTPPSYYTISGTITVAATNAPVANATVTVSGLNGGEVTTNANGYYEKDEIVEGFPYSLMVSTDSYNTVSADFAGIFSDTTINFALTSPGLEVTYAAPIEVTTSYGLNAQFAPVTISNNGDGELTWSTAAEFLDATRSTANSRKSYSVSQTQRDKASIAVSSGIDYCPMTATISGEPTREAWDLLSSFDASAAGQQGVATDGNFIYTCYWNSNGQFEKYDVSGNYIESFTISGVGGVRDLTYDGTYFYGGAGSSTLYQMDFNSQTLVASITTQVSTIRHCSYDSENDGFWVGNWTDLYLIDRSGNIVVTGPAIEDAYGSAYDPYTAGGPFLWLFTQAQDANSQCVFVQYDINANSLTNTTVDISTIDAGVSANDATAGGAFATDALVSGKFVMMANSQQSPNHISIFELANAGWLSATPGSGHVAAGQSIDLTLNFDGNNPVGDYNANLIISSRNPFVGDTVIPVIFHIVAPDCDAPTNMQAVATDYEYMALTWDAPADVTNLVEYRIYRNGSSNYMTSTTNSYEDHVPAGNYCYFVKAYYEDGDEQCLSLPSDTACDELFNCHPDSMCAIRIEMVDSYGDGWNGASIQISANGAAMGTATCAASSESYTVDVCPGTLSFTWVAGSYDSECSFTIQNALGAVLFNGSTAPSAGEFFTYNLDCQNLEPPVGITETENNSEVSFFPNPANTVLNVHAENFDNVQIINFLGQVVYSANITENDFQINVSNLSNGVYFLRLNGENTITKKFVKK